MRKFHLLAALGLVLTASASLARTPAGAPSAFDINKIPVTNKDVGKFPFFSPPEGYRFGHGKKEFESLKNFDRFYHVVGEEKLHPVEGKVLKARLNKEGEGRPETLLIERNYEKAITAAGGVKVFDGTPNFAKTYKTLSEREYYEYGPDVNDRKDVTKQTYIIRTKDAEIWIEVSCSRTACYYYVTQKGEMKQSVKTISANEMKEALDKQGHIALYINFDVDKAVIKPDSQSTVDEIATLLETHPTLKILIEGHTDNTGNAAHNQALSENRAAAVYGALLAKGITQSRLQSKGFGASKPIADNGTEEGRAKNRRVEIVKIV